jgi:dTDP-4-dehydrorhamnose reductase
MIEPKKILFTGGSGLLGREVRKLLPDALYPSSAEFDVTNDAQIHQYIQGKSLSVLVHAAALTSPPRVDKEPARAIEVNIVGTANVARLCMAHGLKLVYISTDYVFRGDQGNYGEEDAVHPVNKYAWSKLGGECAARMADNWLIVRTTFGPNVFPYEKAFVDQYTSRQSVSQIAAKLVGLLGHDLTGVIHLGGPRRTVYEYAVSLDPSRPIQKLSIHDVNFRVPVDTSLRCERYERLDVASE